MTKIGRLKEAVQSAKEALKPFAARHNAEALGTPAEEESVTHTFQEKDLATAYRALADLWQFATPEFLDLVERTLEKTFTKPSENLPEGWIHCSWCGANNGGHYNKTIQHRPHCLLAEL
ncbi:MAG TPA: hypothetical protein VKU00_19540 [Chthonomonadaceae bacterium]|nr:hypothetical protein [Chthonomonadaceae bacterium]